MAVADRGPGAPAVPLPIPALAEPETDEDGTFDLDFSVFNTPSNLTGWQILEAADYSRLLADDMEKPFAESTWSASEPTNPDIAPWQESDSSARKIRSDVHGSGARSYWTGVPMDQLSPGTVQQGESVMQAQGAAPGPAGGRCGALVQLAVPQRGRRFRLCPDRRGGRRLPGLGDRRHRRRRGPRTPATRAIPATR